MRLSSTYQNGELLYKGSYYKLFTVYLRWTFSFFPILFSLHFHLGLFPRYTISTQLLFSEHVFERTQSKTPYIEILSKPECSPKAVHTKGTKIIQIKQINEWKLLKTKHPISNYDFFVFSKAVSLFCALYSRLIMWRLLFNPKMIPL
jgi:hypothetical protein